MNKKKTKLLVALLVVIGGIGALVYGSMQDTVTYYMKPSEILAKAKAGEKVYGQRVRVGGTIVAKMTKGSAAVRKWEFTVTDSNDPSKMEIVSLKETLPDNRVLIKYQGVLPDTFQDGAIAIAEGTMDKNNVFTAESVLAKCPSKYEAADKKRKDMGTKGRADKANRRDAGKLIQQ